MKIEVFDRNGFRVVRLLEDIITLNDLEDFKKAVKPHFDDGAKNIALSFTNKSVFFSRAIAVLVQLLGYVKERDGNFAVVHPDSNMLKMLTLIGLGKLIYTCQTEDQLGEAS